MPPHEALERGRVALVPADGDLPPRADLGGHAGTPAGLGLSLLRASAGGRLALVAVALGVLWLAVLWALT